MFRSLIGSQSRDSSGLPFIQREESSTVPFLQREPRLTAAATVSNSDFYRSSRSNTTMRTFLSQPPTTPPRNEMVAEHQDLAEQQEYLAEQQEYLASRSAAHYRGLNPSYFAGVQPMPRRRIPVAYATDPAVAAYSSYANPSAMASLPGAMQAAAVPTMGIHAAMARQALLAGQMTNLQKGVPPSNSSSEETGEQEVSSKRRKAGRPAEDEAWTAMFMRLFKYKQENGDCLVPVRYKKDPKLGAWVRNQRIRKHTFSEHRRQRLEAIGFEWSVREKRQREIWDSMFSRLLKYKGIHKDCMVPQRYREDPKLGTWVHNQRLRRTSLPKDRIHLLDAIGFAWSGVTR